MEAIKNIFLDRTPKKCRTRNIGFFILILFLFLSSYAKAQLNSLNGSSKKQDKFTRFIGIYSFDSLLDNICKELKLDLTNARLVSPMVYDSIQTCWMNHSIRYTQIERTYTYQPASAILRKVKKSAQSELQKWFWSDITWGNYFSDKPEAFYLLYVSPYDEDVNNNRYCFKYIEQLHEPSPLPDSLIGKDSSLRKYNLPDGYAVKIQANDIAFLAKKLCNNQKDDIWKVRAIYSWIRSNISYDYKGLSDGGIIFEPIEVMKKRRGVCQGFADLFTELCGFAGLRAQTVMGKVKTGSQEIADHAWNVVLINGKWYLIDCTWGDNYYLASPGIFLRDHFPLYRKWALFPEHPSWDWFVKTQLQP